VAKKGGKGKKGGKSNGGKGGDGKWGSSGDDSWGGKWDAKWSDSKGSDYSGWSGSSGSKWGSKNYDAAWEDSGESSWKKTAGAYGMDGWKEGRNGGRDDFWGQKDDAYSGSRSGGKHESWTSTEKSWTSELGSRAMQSGSGGQRRGRQEDDLPTERRSKQIKVKNIPHDLDWRDIKGAFESEAGKISRCELERGTAWITFDRPEDARKAVETFDRGELNGKTIEVSIER